MIRLRMGLVLATGLTIAAAPSATPTCASLADTALGCMEGTQGIVIALSAADAQRVQPSLLQAEARFRRFFGHTPPHYAVAYGNEPTITANLRRLETAQPALASFVLASAQQRARPAEIVRALTEALSKGGLPSAEVERQVEAQLAAMKLGTVAKHEANDLFVVPHELGHALFAETFWPAHDPASRDDYLTPAPDWIDEGAAQIMESAGPEAFDAKHLEAIAEGRSMIEDRGLAYILAMEHPGQKLKALPRDQIPATGLDDKQLRALGVESVPDFYTLSAALTAYLIDRSRNPQIMAELSASMAGGKTFDDWLKASGQRHGLPATRAALERDWFAWLDRLEPATRPEQR